MLIVGVIDLRRGRAVHARGGQRDRYEPVLAAAGEPIDGDATRLARAYVSRFGLTDVYVADLDAIDHGVRQPGVSDLARLVPRLWLDCAVTSVDEARETLEAGASRVIVGLETLDSFDRLSEICAAIGGERVVFSLDLRGGVAMTDRTGQPPAAPAEQIAARAAAAGAATIIVLDVARVGMRAGCDVGLIARVRREVPALSIFAGGGVRGWDDLRRLSDEGCEGALVATALLDGTLQPPA
jgi:phosphoribosylformimino-5-aminoimidazole carboxamide ribotide isomerase